MENSTDTCPSNPGLRNEGGLSQPGFNFSDAIRHPMYNWHVVGWTVCIAFLAIIWVVSLNIVWRHLRSYCDPDVQKHKLRVLLFPPFYATLAWFSYLRYDYSTTIMFFATLFEAFAVFNLYTCLQAYLQPFRDEAGNTKEEVTTTVFFFFKVHLKSKWGLHYRVITDILVFQFPLWSIIDAFISIFAELKGRYCPGSYNFHGAHVYLVIINFCSLSVILTALFTYLAVFDKEWKRGKIPAHGMFWCVKGPIMVIFYFGEILLSILETVHVIKGTDGSHSKDGIAWPPQAVKNGLYVIIICVVMCVVVFLMAKYFGPQDAVTKHHMEGEDEEGKKMSPWMAFVDGYLWYIPMFFYSVLCCGVDSYRLVKKRVELKARKKRGEVTVGDTSQHLLQTTPQRLPSMVDQMNPTYPAAAAPPALSSSVPV